MGWRSQNTYDKEAHERWRALPFRERYSNGALLRLSIVVVVALMMLFALLVS
jgi:hypothetical protein